MRISGALAAIALVGVVAAMPRTHAQAGGAVAAASSSAGPQATTCGNPVPPAPAAGAPLARGTEPIFPAGQYPVQLPAKSLLGAPNDLPNPFQAGVDWGQLPAGRKWGSTASVTTAPDGTIWVADRCGKSGAGGDLCGGASATVDPIFQFDPSGKLLKSFGAGLFTSPHKLTIDAAGNLWMADNGQHQVMKLDQNGKILMTLGKKGVAGAGNDEFDAPTEVAIAPNGDIFVADGHTGGGTAVGNARVVKFDRTGKFIKAWGKKGMGPGEFDMPHTLAFDSRGRLFVGDRQNNRVQIFDQDGRFLAQWFQFGRPSGIYIDQRTDTLYVADSESRDGRTNLGRNGLPDTGYGFNLGGRRGIRIGSARDGEVKYFIPDPCPYPYGSASSLAEGVTTDRDGNVYGADNLTDVRKFVLDKSAATLPNPYQAALRNWGTLPDGRTWGSTAGIEMGPKGEIWAIERCGANTCDESTLPPIQELDLATGRPIKSIGAGLFVFPHGLHVDRDGNLWVTDAQTSKDGTKGQQVIKLSPDGKVLMRLGTAGKAGGGPDHFQEPSDVVTTRAGDIFVVDGHSGQLDTVSADYVTRVIKFTKDGKFVNAWGRLGAGPGEFHNAHAVAVDSRGRLFVADRGNARLQIFDQDGKFLAEWKQFGRPSGLYIDKDDTLYVIDADSTSVNHPGWKKGVWIGSAKDGKVTGFVPGHVDGGPDGAAGEGVVVGPDGNLYAAENTLKGITRYLKK